MTTQDKVLLAAPERPKSPASEMLVKVARDIKVSPVRQFREMLRLNFAPLKLEFNQYYANRVYRPELSMDEKKQFVGLAGSHVVNGRMTPKALLEIVSKSGIVHDKVLFGGLLSQFGFATPENQALASSYRRYGNLPALRDADAVVNFLKNDARYPLFAKPLDGSGSIGSALITGCDGAAGTLALANGESIDLNRFAQEIFRDYGTGFQFQTAIRQHPVLKAVTGDVIGTVRVVTVFSGDTPELLYALWKLPAPQAMSDNFWQADSMLAHLDANTGTVTGAMAGTGPDAAPIDTHPVSQAALTGLQIPHWDQIRACATGAQQLIPELGVFGWDIAVTEAGPLIIEGNTSPHHSLYQLATGRGVLNDDLSPRIDAAAARAQSVLKAKQAALKALKKSGK